MADRYWVGGTASWDGTAGTKWSATSGGAGGASVPTTADDVFFDANSTGTVTIASGNTGAKSINCTGFTGTIAGTAAISVAGGVTLVAGMTYTHTGTITFTGTGTLTTAGKTFSGVTVNGTGITLTLGDALNTGTRNISIPRGAFNTASYNVTCASFSSTEPAGTAREITLGSSTLTLSGSVNFTSSTGLTFNANTSQINLTATSPSVDGGGLTFYNVSFTNTSVGTRSISGANTFNNLTLNASGTGLSQLSVAANQTVNGTFTCAGSSAIARGFVRSDVIGTTRTITAAAISANDCDFRDITIAGAAAGASPTRAGDAGGNSGITFPAAKTVYRVGTNATWAGSSSWATTSGGTGSNDNFPLAQDTAVINEDTALTGTLSFTTRYSVSAIDCSARTSAITLSHNIIQTIYGSYTLGSGVTLTGTSNQFFAGRGTMVFTSAGKTITFPLFVEAPGGTFRLGDAYSSSSEVTLTVGTFDANNYNLTCTAFTSNTNLTRTITMGSGLWTLSGAHSPWTIGSTALTFNKDTADILLSGNTTAGRTFTSPAAGLAYNKLTIGGATSTSVTAFSGQNSFTELASTKTVAHTVRFNTNQGTIDTWSITGTAGNVVTFEGFGAGTRRTFSLTNVTSGIDYLSVRDIGVNQANRFYVGANSTDNGNNLNVIFTAAPGVTLTQNTRYDNTNTFYAATITQTGGAVTLLPARYDNTNTFYSATVTAGAVTLLPARYDNTNTFYSATVTPGAVTLLPARFDNTNTFYAATITPGAVTLLPARYDNTNTFYAATITLGDPVLLPDLVVNVNTFYSAALLSRITLSPPLTTNTNVFYSASLRSLATLLPARLDNANTFYAALVRGGSPVPIPYHPFCDRGSLQIEELARANMVVPEAARQSMVVTTAPRKPLYPGC